MPITLSGRSENIPYSLSRWTDVPAAKWGWLRQQLRQGWMVAIDQRTSVPARWSLRPEDTLGLIFWTKDPRNLLADADRLKAFQIKVHVTVTGWGEVEKGAPSLYEGARLLCEVSKVFGPENVTWRFTPVPILHDVEQRFRAIAAMAGDAGIQKCFVTFLQENDLLPETRTAAEKVRVLRQFAEDAAFYKIKLWLCHDDRALLSGERLHRNLDLGVCSPPEDFTIPGVPLTPGDKCGCSVVVDPFTVNESCTMGCSYCLSPDTPILYSDMVWRPIGEVQTGDRLVGFDEFPTDSGLGARKLRESVVEAVTWARKPGIRIVTEESDVLTTAEHGWLNDRGQWRSTRGLWYNNTHPSRLKQIGMVRELPISEDYRIGYLAGMTLGDGTMRYQAGQRSEKRGFPQAYWRVALKDEEPLGRLVSYLASMGVEAHIRPFDPGPNSSTLMQKVEVRALRKLEAISDWALQERDSQEYRRGFLAGFYDAEGSCEARSNLRMSQKDPNVLRRVVSYGAKLGFHFEIESYSLATPTCRLTGHLRDRLRFISTVQPALTRKAPEWNGAALVASEDPVQAKENGPVCDVIDIQTSTSTFFAGGLASHNCYAADSSTAPKKRNTTRSLPIIK